MDHSKIIQACVTKRISYLERKYPDDPEFTTTQKVAASYDYCRKKHKIKEDFYNGIFERALKTDFYREDAEDKRPPKEWWDSCYETIKKKNPNYTDEQIRKTCGALWHKKGIKKKIHDFGEIKEDINLPGIREPKFEYDWEALRNIVGAEAPYAVAAPGGRRITGLRTFTDRPMTPIGSSTVKGAGVFDTDLLVQFHDTQGTYRYHFDTPQQASQAWMDLVNARSAGEFVWEKFRGHKKGEKVTPQKIGPAYFSGRPTIGGTTASLVEYDIAARTPQIRMPNYEELAREMRKYKTMVKVPPEAPEEFTPEEIIQAQRLKILGLLEKEFAELLKTDFIEKMYVLGGPITRGGVFLYPKTWELKDYYQLKQLYEMFGHIPAYSAMKHQGHNEKEVIGFGIDWDFHDPNNENPNGKINAKIHIFPDIIEKYGLTKEDLKDIPVSVKQFDAADHAKTPFQYITDLYHIAVSLDKTMTDRCGLSGDPCRVSIIEDGISQIADNSIPIGKDSAFSPTNDPRSVGTGRIGADYKKLNMGDKLMPNNEEDETKVKEDAEAQQVPASPDEKTGDDIVLFGETEEDMMYIKACKEAGKSPTECAEMLAAKKTAGTGAKGTPKKGDPDKYKRDLAEFKLQLKNDIMNELRKEQEEEKAIEIRENLVEDGVCKDFVGSLNLKQLEAFKNQRTSDLEALKKKYDIIEAREDVVSDSEMWNPPIREDFEEALTKKLQSLRTDKFGWAN